MAAEESGPPYVNSNPAIQPNLIGVLETDVVGSNYLTVQCRRSEDIAPSNCSPRLAYEWAGKVFSMTGLRDCIMTEFLMLKILVRVRARMH